MPRSHVKEPVMTDLHQDAAAVAENSSDKTVHSVLVHHWAEPPMNQLSEAKKKTHI